MKRACLLFFAFVLVVTRGGIAAAAPLKVACIGEHTTHSHAFPATNREAQPVGMQEYPAILQGKLGAAYQVRNFGDCCATVTQGYNTTGQETHPFVQGSNAGDGPGYAESIAFLPDIVVIGSWGRHDWGKAKATTETWSLPKFKTDYDDLVQRYMNLSTHPRIFVSLPVPILNGTDGPDNGVLTSAVSAVIKEVAAKYNLPIVDLYAPFFGHMELFKQPPDPEGEGEHVTNAGLQIIADKVYAAMMADVADGGTEAGTGAADASDARADVAVDASGEAGAGGTTGAGGSAGGSAGGAGATGAGGSTGGASTSGSGGTGSATGGASGATGGATSGSSTTGTATPPSSSEGCSCRLGSSSRAPRWIHLAAFVTFAIARARRRHR